MMKQMGIENPGAERVGNAEDEYDKVLKQMGINPNKNEDEDILAMLDKENADMNDDDLLA